MKIYCYYDDTIRPEDELMVDIWLRSWSESDFTPEVLTPENINGYQNYLDQLDSLHKQITGKPLTPYGKACFLRWYAYSKSCDEYIYTGDYDVLHNRLKPEQQNVLCLRDGACPCLVSGAPRNFSQLCDDFIQVTTDNIDHVKSNWNSSMVHFHDQEFLVICIDMLSQHVEQSRDVDLFNNRDRDQYNLPAVHFASSTIKREFGYASASIRLEAMKQFVA